MAIQEKLVDSQVELNDAQIAIMEKRLELMEKGEAAYNIAVSVEGDIDGWLSGLVASLMEEIILKASEENFNCLCEV